MGSIICELILIIDQQSFSEHTLHANGYLGVIAKNTKIKVPPLVEFVNSSRQDRLKATSILNK